MENARLHFAVLLATYSLLTRYCLSAEDKKPCDRKQNGTIGGVGIIQCSFESGFNEVIVWSYAGNDTETLVRYDYGVFQSPGNDSNSYSIRIDGALLIIDAATRTGSKEYKVETPNIDGEPKEQIVEYQFVGESTATHRPATVSPTTCSVTETTSSGESTTIRHPTTVSTTTCPVTETTSCGCQGKNEGFALDLRSFFLGVVVGAVVGAVVGGAGVVVYRRCKRECVNSSSSDDNTSESSQEPQESNPLQGNSDPNGMAVETSDDNQGRQASNDQTPK